VTVSQPEVGRHDRVLAAITTRVTTGVDGKTRRSYTLAAKAVTPAGGCVIDRDEQFPDRPAGTRVQAALDLAHGEGGETGWCPGRYQGTVTYHEGFACPPEGTCDIPAGFPTRTDVAARFSFHVK
jgi:hypothetical protein